MVVLLTIKLWLQVLVAARPLYILAKSFGFGIAHNKRHNQRNKNISNQCRSMQTGRQRTNEQQKKNNTLLNNTVSTILHTATQPILVCVDFVCFSFFERVCALCSMCGGNQLNKAEHMNDGQITCHYDLVRSNAIYSYGKRTHTEHSDPTKKHLPMQSHVLHTQNKGPEKRAKRSRKRFPGEFFSTKNSRNISVVI